MNYAAKIEKDKDMGFVVSFPDLPNVNAFGDTQEEALRQSKDALDGAMECDLDLGNTMILPKTMPDSDKAAGIRETPVEDGIARILRPGT